MTVCQNCLRPFNRFNEDSVKLYVYLDDAVRESYFCSAKCYETKVSNINSGTSKFDLRIKIISTQVVREKPFFIKMVTKIEDFKLENALYEKTISKF